MIRLPPKPFQPSRPKRKARIYSITWKPTSRWTGLTAVCLVTLLIQSYHQVEHSVKLMQFLHNSMAGTPGILGAHFDLILLHFTINALVYLPLVILFFGAGFHKRQLPGRAG